MIQPHSLPRRFGTAILAGSVLMTAVFALFSSHQPVRAQNTPGVVLKSHRVSVTIEDQIATTKIEQVFVNNGGGLAEGEYIFPLPTGAAVTNLTLYIDGQPVKADLLGAGQAQNIYNDIVRRRRDPALLKYIGRDAVQANIFPIPPGQERKIELTYAQVLTSENGLYRYAYPLMTDYLNKISAQNVNVALTIKTTREIGTAYSPNAGVLVQQISEDEVRAGYESTSGASSDFEVYFSQGAGEVNADLITYRAGANEDGYFMLLLTPPNKVAAKVLPKDVIIVLDQSGSMVGPKWDQAVSAVKSVLGQLNSEDRFNVVAFSSAFRTFASSMQAPASVDKATRWLDGLEPIGGTNISDALATAAGLRDSTRDTVILFLTDGLPTEGITDSKGILNDFATRAGQSSTVSANSRIQLFAFGVGDDVDTFLLDSLSTAYGGTSSYVRPGEDIKTKVNALYTKISAPVLRNLKLQVDGVTLEDLVPAGKLPDLFLGGQLVIVGRFRDGVSGKVTLTGETRDGAQTYTFDNLTFPELAGGQPFVARLWAQRKIGALLNQIRLNGENAELVQSVITLSTRYGILTPYTSYLAVEPGMINPPPQIDVVPPPIVPFPMPQPRSTNGDGSTTGTGGGFAGAAPAVGADASGAGAVEKAAESNALVESDQVAVAPTMAAGMVAPGQSEAVPGRMAGIANGTIKTAADRTFLYRDGIWIDTTYTDPNLTPIVVQFLSDEYFALLAANPQIAPYLSVGEHVVVMIGDKVYEIKP